MIPRAVVTHMANSTHLGNFEISRRLGRDPTFLNAYTTKGSIPSLLLLTKIAAVCGYEVHLIGHGEDITVEVPEE